ncbi:MAG: hypothetical protein AB1652_05955 [Bacillota bacterium]
MIFTEPGLDAAGLQLIIALKKEFPELEVVLTGGGPGALFLSLLKNEVTVRAEDFSR